MRLLILTIAAGVAMAAETPKPTPPVTKVLSENDQLKVENIQLRMQLATAPLNAELNAVFERACVSIGGQSLQDCVPNGPSQAQPKAPFSVTLKAPVQAKVESKK